MRILLPFCFFRCKRRKTRGVRKDQGSIARFLLPIIIRRQKMIGEFQFDASRTREMRPCTRFLFADPDISQPDLFLALLRHYVAIGVITVCRIVDNSTICNARHYVFFFSFIITSSQLFKISLVNCCELNNLVIAKIVSNLFERRV